MIAKYNIIDSGIVPHKKYPCTVYSVSNSRFSGKSYIDFGDVFSFSISDKFSFSFTIKIGSITPMYDNSVISKMINNRGYAIILDRKSSSLIFKLMYDDKRCIVVGSNVTLLFGIPYNVIISYNGNRSYTGTAIYINEIDTMFKIKDNILGFNIISHSSDFHVGEFNGYLSNLKIYNSDTDKYYAKYTKYEKELPNMIHRYLCNENGGNKLTDSISGCDFITNDIIQWKYRDKLNTTCIRIPTNVIASFNGTLPFVISVVFDIKPYIFIEDDVILCDNRHKIYVDEEGHICYNISGNFHYESINRLKINEWNRIIVTTDGKIYINRVLNDSIQIKCKKDIYTSMTSISYHGGYLDNILIYDDVLDNNYINIYLSKNDFTRERKMYLCAKYNFKGGLIVHNELSDKYNGVLFSSHIYESVIDFGLPNVSYATINNILYSDYNTIELKISTISDYGTYLFNHCDRSIYIDGLGRILINNKYITVKQGFNDDIKHTICVNLDKNDIYIDEIREELREFNFDEQISTDDMMIGCGFDGSIYFIKIDYSLNIIPK